MLVRDFTICPRCGAPTKKATAFNNGESEFWYECTKCNTYINTYIPQEHQASVHTDTHRFILNAGGYGSGKTTTSRQEFYKHLFLTEGGNTLIGANIAPQYEQTIKRDIENDIPAAFVKDSSSQKQYIDFINESINDNFKYISGESGLSIQYVDNIELEEYDYESIRKKLKHKLYKNYNRELQYGMTMYGPHRDDLIFNYQGKDLKIYGSQGQQKIAILCFKLSEIPIFKNISGFYPVLLLDDIFSELDIKKRNKLLKLINDFEIQSIITTTDLKNINKKNLDDTFIFEVKNANIVRK